MHVARGLDVTVLTGKLCPDKSIFVGDQVVRHRLGLQGIKL